MSVFVQKVRRLKSICVMRFFIFLYCCFANLTRDMGENLRLLGVF